MGKGSKRSALTHRTKDDALAASAATIDELSLLNSGYDRGDIRLARTMAQSVNRLIADELQHTGERRRIRFVSTSKEPNPRNLFPQWKLIVIRVETKVDKMGRFRVEFLPDIEEIHTSKNQIWLKFSDWCSEKVLIEGASGFGFSVSIKKQDHIAFEKRRSITRQGLINRTRNEVGSHFSRGVSDEFQFSRSWGKKFPIVVNSPSGEKISLVEHPDRFTVINTPADAMIRRISEEIVISGQRWNFASSLV